MLYATWFEYRIDMELGTGDFFGPLIQEQKRIYGSTNTEWAMDNAYTHFWDGNVNSSRVQRTFLVTDGDPATGQIPCRQLDQYIDNGNHLKTSTILHRLFILLCLSLKNKTSLDLI